MKIRDAGSGVLPVGGEVLAALALAVGAATQPLGLDAAAGVAKVGLTLWNKKQVMLIFLRDSGSISAQKTKARSLSLCDTK